MSGSIPAAVVNRTGLLIFSLVPCVAMAGSYLFASESNGLDVIAHPSGYNGNGGTLNVEVCIDADASDASAMVASIKNVIDEINRLQPATPNLFSGNSNNIPGGQVDFESLALHEIGHCIGLAHPNLGIRTGVSGSNAEFTNSTNGGNAYSFNDGSDNIIGSSDDLRDNDVNLNWFETGVNNPFEAISNPSESNMTRDLNDLPNGHQYAANAGRAVGALLGFPDTEAVMQQGQSYDEAQRQLQASDVAALRFAMTGLDEESGTSDDYVINLVYGGIQSDTSSCDVIVRSSTEGFGSCSVNGSFLFGGSDQDYPHISIGTGIFTYNSDFNWFFNSREVYCEGGTEDLFLENIVENGSAEHTACLSITFGPNYTIGNEGSVLASAPTVILQPGTAINGEFRAETGED